MGHHLNMARTEFTSIEVIFQSDPGNANEGWYVRSVDADGHQEDTAISEDWGTDATTEDATIMAWAVPYFWHPDGMSDAEGQELRNMIEVRRS